MFLHPASPHPCKYSNEFQKYYPDGIHIIYSIIVGFSSFAAVAFPPIQSSGCYTEEDVTIITNAMKVFAHGLASSFLFKQRSSRMLSTRGHVRRSFPVQLII